MPENAALIARFDRYVQEHGLKHTRQRQVILETFLDTEDHVSVDQVLARVQDRMAGVGYATVYRALRLFLEAGVANERQFGDGQTRYEPVRIGEHHDHLICLDCGHIFEFEDDEIEARQRDMARRHGLSIVSHRHDVFGRCEAPETCSWREAEDARRRTG